MASISTHVLDTGRGEPAENVAVELYRGHELLAREETDAGGRITELGRASLGPGRYRLVFHPPSAFFARVELELELEDAERHYHVPLLVSAYSCASYRGS
ncbi:MAG: hydroxyisourate hydrolase [Actinobacteria bacterium]|nr:hydroxyisourate hydrolase [Actinomycetota bacterium]